MREEATHPVIAGAARDLRRQLLNVVYKSAHGTPAQLLRKELLARRTRPGHAPGRKRKDKLTRPMRVSAYGTPASYLAPKMSPEENARNEAQIKLLEKACLP